MKQFLPLKPIKRGYKGWLLSDSHSAYAYDFDIYEGNSNSSCKIILSKKLFYKYKIKGATKNATPDQIELSKELGCGGSALWNLTCDLSDHHKLFFDRYFNSIPLLEKLKTRNLYACGTIMSNRKGVPKDFASDRLMQRGDSFTKHRNGLYVTKWMEKKQ